MKDTVIIFTCQADFADLCLNELRALEPEGAGSLECWLAPGVGLFRLTGTFPAIAARLREARGPGSKRLLFLRHVFPLDASFPLDETDVAGNPQAHAFLTDCIRSMDREKPFSVQVRSLDPKEEGMDIHALQYFFVDGLMEKGFVCDGSRPETVLSAVVRERTVYIGRSAAADNLSDWPGGMRRFARREDQISRAEFKLLEAIEAFSLPLPPEGEAIDLGAAPGGWTKVLLDRGMRVTAVDPAALSPALAGDPRVEHYRGLAQEYVKDTKGSGRAFDILVNDMRMEPAESAGVACDAADRLSPDGLAVMTFKLPMKKRTEAIRKGFSVFEKRYQVLYARQLFHNRSEITVVGKRR